MSDSAYFRELMLRAPPVPEWFMPEVEPPPLPENILVQRYEAERGHITRPATFEDHEFLKANDVWQVRLKREAVIQWPSYYAREVIKAAGATAQEAQPKKALTLTVGNWYETEQGVFKAQFHDSHVVWLGTLQYTIQGGKPFLHAGPVIRQVQVCGVPE